MTAILLTGVTGSLGGHLAAALLAQPHPVIYCLVRATGPAAADRRLRERMAEVGVDDPQRLIAVPADLDRPGLGMPPKVWNDLAERVSRIYHSAASVHMTAPYHDLAPSNVGGTRALVELATAAGRPVGFHFVSTIAVFADAARAGLSRVDEMTPPSMATSGHLGYPRSKVAAERVVTRAAERGVTATIYRPGLVTGHSGTGGTSTSDLLMPLLRAAVAVGAVPERVEAVPMDAVDQVAGNLARLSVGPSAAGRAYHLVKPQPVALTHGFDALRRAGYPLDSLPGPVWWERATERATHPDVAPLIQMGKIGRRMLGLEPAYPMPEISAEHTWAALRAAEPAPPSVPLDDAFFDRLIAHGFSQAIRERPILTR
ncbi:thioester reductase domain-containing protein [Micromonospora sp. DT48]|uniref:thioester reductase domain-containing protein n=1 Tax=Micromonospora sp. DT48 TaxID=3393429 RepID=UPI003CF7D014